MSELLPNEGGEVESGTPVTVTAVWTTDPGREPGKIEVFASFLRPQVSRATVDPGYDNEGSRIRRLGRGIYSYVIDTTGFKDGKCTWHIWGMDNAHKTGWFTVKSRDERLL